VDLIWFSLPLDHQFGEAESHLEAVPLKYSISTQEQNCGPAEEFPQRVIHPDKYHLSQYLVHKPNPGLRPVLHLI
jgi:hypothetical protein